MSRRSRTGGFPNRDEFHDDIELALAVMVHRLSGMVVPNRRASLLELGVTSLHLAELFAEVERVYRVDLPLTTVIDRRSVSALAEAIREHDPSWPTVVPVRESGAEPPLFVVHGAYGNVVMAWPLAQALGDDVPVYAIQHPAIEGYVPQETALDALVARYVAAILEAAPTGPYRFLGVSGGGCIAIEIARSLRAVGHDVGVVFLLDTYAPSPPAPDLEPLGEYRVGGDRPAFSIRRLLRRLRWALGEDGLSKVKWSVWTVRDEARYSTWLWSTRRTLARDGRVRPRDRRRLVRDLGRHLLHAYAPGPVDAPVVLLRATESEDDRRTRGWSHWMPVEVIDVDGDHNAILMPANIDANVAKIRRRLDAEGVPSRTVDAS